MKHTTALAFSDSASRNSGRKSILDNNTLDTIKGYLKNDHEDLEPDKALELKLTCLEGLSSFVKNEKGGNSAPSKTNQKYVQEKGLLSTVFNLFVEANRAIQGATTQANTLIKESASQTMTAFIIGNLENSIFTLKAIQKPREEATTFYSYGDEKRMLFECLRTLTASVMEKREGGFVPLREAQNEIRERGLLIPIVKMTMVKDLDIRNSATLAVNAFLNDNQENSIIGITALQVFFWLSFINESSAYTYLNENLRRRVVSVDLTHSAREAEKTPSPGLTSRPQSPQLSMGEDGKIQTFDEFQANYEATSPKNKHRSISDLSEVLAERKPLEVLAALQCLSAIAGNTADQDNFLVGKNEKSQEYIIHKAIFSQSADNIKLLLNAGFIGSLLQSSQSKYPVVIEKALSMLTDIAKSTPAARNFFHDEEGIEVLISGFKDSKEPDEFAALHLDTLAKISDKDPVALQKIIDQDMLPLLVQSLADPSSLVCEPAARVLSVLAEGDYAENRVEVAEPVAGQYIKKMMAEGALPLIVNLVDPTVNEDKEKAREWGMKILSFTARAHAKDTLEHIKVIANAGAARGVTNGTKRYTAKTLATLLHNPVDCTHAHKTEDVINALFNSLTGDPESFVDAIEVLHYIASNYDTRENLSAHKDAMIEKIIPVIPLLKSFLESEKPASTNEIMGLLKIIVRVPDSHKVFHDSGLTELLASAIEKGARPPKGYKLKPAELYLTESIELLTALAQTPDPHLNLSAKNTILGSKAIPALAHLLTTPQDRMAALTLLNHLSTDHPKTQQAIVNAGANPTLKKLTNKADTQDLALQILKKLPSRQVKVNLSDLSKVLQGRKNKGKTRSKGLFRKKKEASAKALAGSSAKAMTTATMTAKTTETTAATARETPATATATASATETASNLRGETAKPSSGERRSKIISLTASQAWGNQASLSRQEDSDSHHYADI